MKQLLTYRTHRGARIDETRAHRDDRKALVGELQTPLRSDHERGSFGDAVREHVRLSDF